MILSHALLEVLDFRSNIFSYTNSEISLNNEDVVNYIENIISKVFINGNKKSGTFNEQSKLLDLVKEYKNKEIDFVDFCKSFSKSVQSILSNCENYGVIDLLCSNYRVDEKEYVSFVFLENQEAFTHTVSTISGNYENQIMKNYSILPSSIVKINTFLIINMNDFSIFSLEKERKVNNEFHKVLEENYYDASFMKSTNRLYEILKTSTKKVSVDNSLNSLETLNQLKGFLLDHKQEKSISMEDLVETIFESESEKKEFSQMVQNEGIQKEIEIEIPIVEKKIMNQKIKTDSGIEISIPQRYFNDQNYVEFSTHSDGTISISLKNIGKITNR